MVVETRIDGLSEVDDFCLPLPVQNVMGRKVAMDVVVGQPEFDIAHEVVEHSAGLFEGELAACERGGGAFAVTKILHEDGMVGVGNGVGNICSCTRES